MKKTYSLRQRLVTWIGGSILTALLLAMTTSYFFARYEIEEVYDAQLVHSAKVLLQLTRHEITEDEGFHLGIEDTTLEHHYERKLGFRIWNGDKLVAQSPNTEIFSQHEAPPGFSNEEIDGHIWRFFVYLDPADNIKIEVSEHYDIRYELVLQLMGSLILPTLAFIPLILLAVWIGVRKIMKPVVRMSADVDRRSSDDLAPIRAAALPQEIAPLIQALNRLFKRIEDSFRREREFTDHAAHELRTPLAAMKTQTQVLARKAKGVPECAEGLENLQSSIDRATRLVEQLLALARLQNEDLPKEKTNLSGLLDEAVSNVEPGALKKRISLTQNIKENVFIRGHGPSLAILINNLLDNAVKYTPEDGTVTITLKKDGTLEIADTGPGLSDHDKARVFGRFIRADKSGQSGSGLGLAIVKWIADAHNIKIELRDNAPHGLIVRMKGKALP